MSSKRNCLLSLKCFGKNKTSKIDKIKSSLNMPTVKEFIKKNANAGTQTSICDSDPIRQSLSRSHGSSLIAPLYYKSTIAVRQKNTFKPLSSFIHSSTNKNENSFSDISYISKASNPLKNSMNFVSTTSFDDFFANNTHEEPLFQKNSGYAERFSEGIKDKSNNSIRNNPFVVENKKKPKIVAVTPFKKNRIANNRQMIKSNYRPNLPSISILNKSLASGACEN